MGEGVCVWGERGWVVRTAPALSVEGYRCGWVGVYIVASAPRRPSLGSALCTSCCPTTCGHTAAAQEGSGGWVRAAWAVGVGVQARRM